MGRAKDLIDYKFNDGTSVYRSVFSEAGYDQNKMVNLPLRTQLHVLTNHLMNKFGYQSVTVAGVRGRDPTPVQQKTARDALLDLTRATHDMMSALGMPLEAASLNGKVRLVTDPEGKVNYYGSYELGSQTIRVMGGANSYGHEWTHALDHELAARFTNNPTRMNHLLSQYTRASGLNVTDNVQAAFAKLLNTMLFDEAALGARRLQLETEVKKTDRQGNPTKAALAAQDQLNKMEAGGTRLRIQPSEFRTESAMFQPSKAGYWASAYEMLARAHEAYIAHTMENAGVDPRGVVMPDKAYWDLVDRQLKMAYPKADERTAIFKAFDDLHTALRNEQVLQGPPAPKSNYGVSDPHYWPTTAPTTGKTAVAATGRRGISAYRNFTDRLIAAAPFDPSRPSPGDYTWSTRAADFFKALGFSSHGVMNTIIKRAPDGAKPFLREVMDRFAPAPGTGRNVGETMEEALRKRERGWNARYANIIRAHDLLPERMSPEDGLMLRHALVTGDDTYPIDPLDPSQGTKRIPYNITAASGDIRFLMDEIWRTVHDAGIDIGYADRYFPRMIDAPRIFSDTSGFHRAASQVYRLMFDQQVGAPGADPGALLEAWTSMTATRRAMAGGAYPGLAGEMNQLKVNLRQQNVLENNPNRTPAEDAELARLKQAAQAIAAGSHNDLGNHFANMSASDWYGRIVSGSRFDFDKTGPSTAFLKARTLPPEADVLLRDYLHNQPNDAIPHYIQSAARRSSYAERFAPDGSELTRLMDAARDAGMRPEDHRWFTDTVNTLLGAESAHAPPMLRKINNTIHAFGAIVLMPRAMWTALHEPMNASLATGDVRTGIKVFATQFGKLFGSLNATEATEAAQLLGVVTSAMHDSVMLSRMSADYADSPAINKLMTLYYRTTGLTQLTNSQRVGAVAAGNWFLGKLSRMYLDTGTGTKARNGRDEAKRWFNEIGIPEDTHQKFAEWKVQAGDRIPANQLMGHEMSDAYGLAIRRLADRMIQDPYKVDRAVLSNYPILGLPFQLMSFNYQFQRNVLNPLWDRIEHSYGRAKLDAVGRGAGPTAAAVRGITAAGGNMMHSAALAGTVVASALMTSAVRQLLFAPDQWAQHEKDGDLDSYLIDLAFQRSGLNGVLDPVIQLASHMRYDGDLISLMDGASAGWMIKNAKDVLDPFLNVNDSPNTNTRLYNQLRGVYNLVGVPSAAVILTMLGAAGGPLTRIAAGAALQYGTAPGTVNKLTEAVVGEKGAQLEPEKKGLPGLGDIPGLPALPALPGLPGDDEEGPVGHTGGALSGPWGLVDDVAIPAWRYGQQALNRLPGWLKAGALAAGLGYEFYDYLQQAAPFRSASAPERKTR